MLSNNFVKQRNGQGQIPGPPAFVIVFAHFVVVVAPRLENTWEKLDQEIQIIVTALQKTFNLNNLLARIV